MLTPNYVFNAADWTATVNKVAIPWTQLEITFEQFHIPAKFAIEAPLQSVIIPSTLLDTPPEVVIQYKGKDFFVGQLDESRAIGDFDRAEDLLHLTGRDLAAKFVLNKVVSGLPQNKTASEIVTQFALAAGFSRNALDVTQVPNTKPFGEFIKHNYHHITHGLNQHDVLFDLAAFEGFVFRVNKRRVFFGPKPKPTTTVSWQYQRDFNRYEWNKSHLNKDVKVKVISWSGKHVLSNTQGAGSVLLQFYEPKLKDPNAVKAKAVSILQQYQRGIVRMEISEAPGDPGLNDILFAFKVSGIAKGIDQLFYPERIHHVITQDDHVMDISLCNTEIATS